MRTCAANSFVSSGAIARAAVRQRRKVDLRDLQVLEHDGARDLVDLRARRREDDAERLVLRAVLLERERRAEVELVVGPLVDLRLVDQHLRAGEVDDARPRIGRNGRGAAPAPAPMPGTLRHIRRPGRMQADETFA